MNSQATGGRSRASWVRLTAFPEALKRAKVTISAAQSVKPWLNRWGSFPTTEGLSVAYLRTLLESAL
jgi:hypothetical protein